jgi:hypothetical protein
VELDARAVGAALAGIREQLDAVRQMKAQLTSAANATRAVNEMLDRMREGILTRVTEAEAELRVAQPVA